MNIKHLKALQAVMNSGSTRAAAKDLGLSQSGVSRLISQLEQELEIELFIRYKGRLIAKKDVERLLMTASELLEKSEKLYQQAADIKKGHRTRELIKIAVPHTFAFDFIPKVVSRVMKNNPNVVIEILTGNYGYIEQCVDQGDADIGFTRLYDNPRFDFRRVAEGQSVCVMQDDHPLKALNQIEAKDFSGQPLVLLGRQSNTRKDIDYFFHQHRIKPQIKIEAHSVGVACALVASGLGITIVNSVLLSGVRQEGLSALPVNGLPNYAYGLITKHGRKHTPIIDVVTEEIQSELIEKFQ